MSKARGKITKHFTAESALSGLTYELWAGGDGVRVMRDGKSINDAGSHVQTVTLCDVELVAELLRRHRRNR